MNSLSAARQEGKQAERDRQRAIFASRPAKANHEAALAFAFETGLDAEAVVAALAKMPAPARRAGMAHTPPSIKLGPDASEPSSGYEQGAAAMARALGHAP